MTMEMQIRSGAIEGLRRAATDRGSESSPVRVGVRVWTRLRQLRAEARSRFGSDLRLAMCCLGGLIGAACILPFVLYRLGNGEWWPAAANLAFVGNAAAVGLYAWYTGRSVGPGFHLALSSAVASTYAAYMFGLTGALWSYASMVLFFFLLDRRAAVLASIGLVIAVAAQDGVVTKPIDLWTYLVTGMLVCIYSSVFASRTSTQRDRLEELVGQDALTGAGNRRRMEIDLKAAVQAWTPGRAPAAVVILDLDHFKLVNDRYGHEAGDRVLIDFASIVREGLRRDDRLYRYGGEEFVLLLTGLDRAGLVLVLHKLHERIREQLVGPGGPVTVSMGVAVLSDTDDWTGWLSRADGALYAAKREGRDRIVLDEPNAAASHEPQDDRRCV